MNLDLIELVNRVFDEATVKTPPMTLRGGNAVDSYNLPPEYDEQLDQPTDEYLQQFAYWGLPHLDPVSWHYYLPFLINYSLRNATKDSPIESVLAVEATLFGCGSFEVKNYHENRRFLEDTATFSRSKKGLKL